MKTILVLTAALILPATLAHADPNEARFACGAGAEKGAEEAEMGLVYALDGNHLFLNGVEQKQSDVSVMNRGHVWHVNLLEKDGEQRAFQIHDDEPVRMQEILISKDGTQKNVGKSKPCVYMPQDE